MSEPPRPPVAVALRYEHGGTPTVVAKGRGTVAERILAVAAEHGVVVQADPNLAEALARIDLDTEIPPELYRAVAEVIGYVLRVAQARR